MYGGIKVVPFEPWHLNWISFTPIAIGALSNCDINLEQQGKYLAQAGRAYTWMAKGRIISCAGMTPLWKGVADFWSYFGVDTFSGNRRVVLRAFRVYLEEFHTEYRLHRLQAVIKADFPEGIKFAKFYGFENEGLLKNYGPDREDFYRFAKCW
jgi:RimJ/RimL family protein N-acetyltransferase